MEWIRGRTLYEWARVHNPTCRDVLLVLAQVAWTLEVLHRRECLHRDLNVRQCFFGQFQRAEKHN